MFLVVQFNSRTGSKWRGLGTLEPRHREAPVVATHRAAPMGRDFGACATKGKFAVFGCTKSKSPIRLRSCIRPPFFSTLKSVYTAFLIWLHSLSEHWTKTVHVKTVNNFLAALILFLICGCNKHKTSWQYEIVEWDQSVRHELHIQIVSTNWTEVKVINLDQMLSEVGSQGWELVTVDRNRYFLKRPRRDSGNFYLISNPIAREDLPHPILK